MNFHTHGNSPDVGGDDRVVGEQSAAIHSPDATRKILDCLSLPWRALPVAPAFERQQARWWLPGTLSLPTSKMRL